VAFLRKLPFPEKLPAVSRAPKAFIGKKGVLKNENFCLSARQANIPQEYKPYF